MKYWIALFCLLLATTIIGCAQDTSTDEPAVQQPDSITPTDAPILQQSDLIAPTDAPDFPPPTDAPISQQSDLVDQFEIYFQTSNNGHIGDDFPLRHLTVSEMGFPVNYAGYQYRMLNYYIPPEATFIAINFDYRKLGSIAYESQYSETRDYLFLFTLIYELESQSICNFREIETQLSYFDSLDGFYILTVDNELSYISDYFTEFCEDT